MTTELSITLKGPGREDPWIVVRGDDVAEVHKMLAEIHEKDIFTATGRAQSALRVGLSAGRHLGATTVSVEETDTKDKPKAAPKQAETKPEPQQEAKPEAEKKKPPKPAWA